MGDTEGPLRGDLEVALDELLRACLEAEQAYRQAIAAGIRAQDLRELQQARAEDLARVALLLKRRGELPKEPDPERETFREMMTEVKAAFAGEGVHLERCRAAECDVEKTALEALALDPPQPVVQQLDGILRRARAALDRLSQRSEG